MNNPSDEMVEAAIAAYDAAPWNGPDEENVRHYKMRAALEAAALPRREEHPMDKPSEKEVLAAWSTWQLGDEEYGPEAMRAALSAAAFARAEDGEGAVAWQHRVARSNRHSPNQWEWSPWKDGRIPEGARNAQYRRWEERALYTHPAPQPSGPVEARCHNCNGTGSPDYAGFAMDRCSYCGGSGEAHPDDLVVDRFARSMKAKLARKRAEGRGGWEDKEQCSAEFLSRLLREHVDKGDPVDVANLAMMLQQRGEAIRTLTAGKPEQAVPSGLKLHGFSLENARNLVDQYGGDETDMTVEFIRDGHSGPGFYCWCTEYPEDGSTYLGPASEHSYLSFLPAAPTAGG